MIFSRILARARRSEQHGEAAAVHSVARTHVGMVRTVNEDRLLDRPERSLWAIADGMGGLHSGDVAAQMAIDCLDALENPGADAILGALHAANAAIFAKFNSADQRSGTTVVAAHLRGNAIDLFWAGDSRAYRIRGETLELLTRDHSLVQQMVDAGILSPSAAARHPKSNVITRALGVESNVLIDHITVPVLPGDRILLCSDGISRSMAETLPSGPSIASLAQQLVDQAMSRDGSDNASVVLIETPASRA